MCTYTGVTSAPNTLVGLGTAAFPKHCPVCGRKCGWQQQFLPPHQQCSPLFTTHPPSSDTFPSPLHIQGKTLTNLPCCLYTRLFPYSDFPPLSLPGVFWRRAVQCLPTFSPCLPLDNNSPSRGDSSSRVYLLASRKASPTGILLLGMQGCKPCTSGHAELQSWVSWPCRAAALALQQCCGSAQAGSCCRQSCCSPACTKEQPGLCRGAGDAVPRSGTGRASPHSHHGTHNAAEGGLGGCSH